MKPLRNAIKPQPANKNTQRKSRPPASRFGEERIRVNDPLAIGIEEFRGALSLQTRKVILFPKHQTRN
jgi:hypothetical protein